MAASRMGIRALRQNLSRSIERVRRGETIDVTRNGETVARIVPVTYPTRLDQLIAEGRARPASGSLSEYLRRHPPRPGTTEISASETLQEDRGE